MSRSARAVGLLTTVATAAIVLLGASVFQEHRDPTRGAAAATESEPEVTSAQNPETLASHGGVQVRAMLRDRPDMALLVEPGTELWHWTIGRFDGAGTGFPIMWDSADPQNNLTAESGWPHNGSSAFIRVRDPHRMDRFSNAEKLWSRVVFELLNLESWRQYRKVYCDALGGTVSLDEWLDRNTRIEHEAVRRTKRFFHETWKHWMRRIGFDARFARWRSRDSDVYEDWIRQLEGTSYPWIPWGKYYEAHIRRRYLKSATR